MIEQLISYLNASPTAFHAVAQSEGMLEGFTRLEESQPWNLVPGGRYVVTRTEWSASGETRLSSRDDAGINIIRWQRGFDRYRKGQGINSSTVLFSLIRLSEKMRQEWRKYDLIIWRIT